jgi:putative ABC transport system ATP-binding protein
VRRGERHQGARRPPPRYCAGVSMSTLDMPYNPYAATVARPRQAGAPLLSARQVAKTFGRGELETRVLSEVSCDIHPGELVLLCGPSGSGKTTLISILAGLMRPSDGHVALMGMPISVMEEEEVARARRDHVGFVFQSYNLFPALTALENVAEVLTLKGMSRWAAVERAREVLGRVGLENRLSHRPHQLSGGQKQRVAIARALAGNPVLVIGDEVTAALDSTSALAVMELLRAHVGPESAVLIVTHDHRLEQFADRVLEMEDGRLVRARTGAGYGRLREAS